MFLQRLTILSVVSGILLIRATPLAAPKVVLDNATVIGLTLGKTSRFLGIPFAQPPTGDRRFRLPEPIPTYTESFTATSFGPACPQQAISLPLDGKGIVVDEAVDFVVNTIFGAVFPDDEDCLTINVVKPADATPHSKLPVVAWIFGGGFQLGSPSMYDGGNIVKRSIEIDQPVIYVSMNYRVTAFGFLPGKEVKEAGVGNLGLQDQREAFRWIQKYIGAFGGDPTKVTIWGESAGAISVAMHMLANDGNPDGLFRAAFMQSGAPIPVGDITNGQVYYDDLVSRTGCSGANDTLSCLRGVPYQTLKGVVDESPGIFSYQSLRLPWLPRADGVFLSDNSQRLIQQEKVANIPIVSGNCDDEGTLFSLSTLNITKDSQLKTYIKTIWLPAITDEEIDHLMDLYPSTLSQGSPYNTGRLNALSPQFKRIASLQGDTVFQAPRRFFLESLSGKQNTWSFLSKRLKVLPVLGSVHGSDLLNVYHGGDMADYLIHFAATLDPGISWPRYTKESPNLLTFQDGLRLTITQDTYRKEAMKAITKTLLAQPV